MEEASVQGHLIKNQVKHPMSLNWTMAAVSSSQHLVLLSITGIEKHEIQGTQAALASCSPPFTTADTCGGHTSRLQEQAIYIPEMSCQIRRFLSSNSLEIKPKAPRMQGKHPITKLYLQPWNHKAGHVNGKRVWEHSPGGLRSQS